MAFARFKKTLARRSHDFALSTFSYKNISIWRPSFLPLILYTISKTLFFNKNLQRWSKWSLARLLFTIPTLKPIILEKYPGNLIWLSPSHTLPQAYKYLATFLPLFLYIIPENYLL
jgi:hypothetical protein